MARRAILPIAALTLSGLGSAFLVARSSAVTELPPVRSTSARRSASGLRTSTVPAPSAPSSIVSRRCPFGVPLPARMVRSSVYVPADGLHRWDDFLADHAHLNDRGHERLAGVLWEHVRRTDGSRVRH